MQTKQRRNRKRLRYIRKAFNMSKNQETSACGMVIITKRTGQLKACTRCGWLLHNKEKETAWALPEPWRCGFQAKQIYQLDNHIDWKNNESKRR